MSSLSVFGAAGHQLNPQGGVHVTIFGGTELHRQPVARQIVELRQKNAKIGDGGKFVVITLFGGAEISWPTVTQEYVALCDALEDGSLTLADWDRFVADTDGVGSLPVHSITLFGGFDANELPSEDAELDDLSMQKHMGNVPEEVTSSIALAIGQKGAQRLGAVRRAAAATTLAAR